LKIHFVGYSDKFDEWRDYDNEGEYFSFIRLEKAYIPGQQSLEDRKCVFQEQLYRFSLFLTQIFDNLINNNNNKIVH
jgi:hypothetical protein